MTGTVHSISFIFPPFSYSDLSFTVFLMLYNTPTLTLIDSLLLVMIPSTVGLAGLVIKAGESIYCSLSLTDVARRCLCVRLPYSSFRGDNTTNSRVSIHVHW